jgi:HSP20 family protein
MNTPQCKTWPAAAVAGYNESASRLPWELRAFHDFALSPFVRGSRIQPPVEVQETDDSIVVQLDLPGVSKDQVDISLEDGVLSVTGSRTSSASQSIYNERTYGDFRRSISLPSAVNTNNIQASYENGVLVINMHKAEEAKARKIQIA